MGSVAVLRSHDCLRNKPSHPPKHHRNSRTTRQKRNNAAPTPDPKPQVNHPLMGQVKILKRGEQLTKTTPDPPSTTNLYAGSSTCTVSPPPSSVPLPLFITKKIAVVSDATADIRKMLRLEFS